MSIAAANPDIWAVGFEDECWWSRLALPTFSSWAEEGKPLRLLQQSVAKDDPEPKAISCYGLYLPQFDQTWLRFVDGRPVSSITTRFLSWCSEELKALGKKVLLLIWDNASWHISKEVRRWLGKHNRRVKKSGEGVRIVSCLLPQQRYRQELWNEFSSHAATLSPALPSTNPPFSNFAPALTNATK